MIVQLDFSIGIGTVDRDLIRSAMKEIGASASLNDQPNRQYDRDNVVHSTIPHVDKRSVQQRQPFGQEPTLLFTGLV